MPVRRNPPTRIFHVVSVAEVLTSDEDDLDYEYDEDDLDPDIIAMLLARSEAPLMVATSVEEAIYMLGLNRDEKLH